MVTRVLADANVLRSRSLRDWLFMLRNESGMFTVQATEDIVAEVVYTIRREKPQFDGGKMTQIRDHIVTQLDERIVEYPAVGSFPGTDDDDRHVHAAAVTGGSDVLLTADKGWLGLKDDVLDALPYEVHHPDSFFVLADDSSPRVVRAVAIDQAKYWFGRQGTADLPGVLRAADCPEFAERIRRHMLTIDCSEFTR